MGTPSPGLSSDIECVAAQLSELLQQAGYIAVSPPILQPLEVFLEYAGEDIRKRLFSVMDIGGGEYCLRPDLTIPTCRHYLASVDGRVTVENRLCYHGMAFRYHSKCSSKPSEFLQTGAEYFGASDREKADAEVMALAIDGLRSIGCNGFEAEMGDLRLFGAFVDGIAKKSSSKISFWCRSLKQVFHKSDKSFRRLLRQAATAPEDRQKKYASREEELKQLSSIAIEAPMGGRGIMEIQARFRERLERQSLPPLPRETFEVLESFLGIRAPFSQAFGQIRRICDEADIDLSEVLASLERRTECLRACGTNPDKACFSIGFGRRLGYYTGFAFELRLGDVQIAAGGRYDHLLQALGSDRAIPAVGYAARPDRIAALWPEAARKLSTGRSVK